MWHHPRPAPADAAPQVATAGPLQDLQRTSGPPLAPLTITDAADPQLGAGAPLPARLHFTRSPFASPGGPEVEDLPHVRRSRGPWPEAGEVPADDGLLVPHGDGFSVCDIDFDSANMFLPVRPHALPRLPARSPDLVTVCC